MDPCKIQDTSGWQGVAEVVCKKMMTFLPGDRATPAELLQESIFAGVDTDVDASYPEVQVKPRKEKTMVDYLATIANLESPQEEDAEEIKKAVKGRFSPK